MVQVIITISAILGICCAVAGLFYKLAIKEVKMASMMWALTAFLLSVSVATILVDTPQRLRFEDRVRHEFYSLTKSEKLRESVSLHFPWPCLASAYVEKGILETSTRIYVCPFYHRSDSDLALRGLLGHEFGHAQAGHTLDAYTKEHSRVEIDTAQAQATAIGICLAGEEAMIAWSETFDDKSLGRQHLSIARSIRVNINTCQLE